MIQHVSSPAERRSMTKKVDTVLMRIQEEVMRVFRARPQLQHAVARVRVAGNYHPTSVAW